LRIIEVTVANGGTATLSQIARRTALPRSTTHHLLRALVEFGYLVQDGNAQPYRLAPKLFRLTGRQWTAEQLAEAGRPFLHELSRRTGEGTSLAMLCDGEVIIVAKCDPQDPVRVVQEVGTARPVHCTAVGKALLGWLPDAEADAIIGRADFDAKTAKTITTPAAFRQELARVRATGFAIDNEEHILGIRCVATPVRDHSGEVCAALCVLGPKSRMPQRRLMEIRKPLAAVAAELSGRLGHGLPEDEATEGKRPHVLVTVP